MDFSFIFGDTQRLEGKSLEESGLGMPREEFSPLVNNNGDNNGVTDYTGFIQEKIFVNDTQYL